MHHGDFLSHNKKYSLKAVLEPCLGARCGVLVTVDVVNFTRFSILLS